MSNKSLSASVSAMEVQMEPAVECADRQMHCCAPSSDEDSLCEEHTEEEATGASGRPWTRHLSSSSSSSSTFCTDRLSSGYSSIQSVPSPPVSSSLVSPKNPAGFCLLLPPAQRTRRQVKRKNTAAHSGGEADRDEDAANMAFLSLWLIDRKLSSLNASLPGHPPGALWFTGCWWSLSQSSESAIKWLKCQFLSFKCDLKNKSHVFPPIMHFTSAPDGGSAFAWLFLLTSNGIMPKMCSNHWNCRCFWSLVYVVLHLRI